MTGWKLVLYSGIFFNRNLSILTVSRVLMRAYNAKRARKKNPGNRSRFPTSNNHM